MNFLKKGLGLVLLFLGLAVIFYSLYSSFNIFTARAEAPEIFQAEDQDLPSDGIQDQIQEMIEQQLKGMLPVESLPTLFNLISWSIFAGILIFGGSQVSSLGIKLIK